MQPGKTAKSRERHEIDHAAPTVLLLLAFLVVIANARTAQIAEDFSSDPAQRGWRVFGNGSLFHWNPTNRNLEATWDSSQSNSFFYLPLGTVLTKSDDFSFTVDVRLSDIRLGNTPGKSNEFEIAIGLLNYRSATNAMSFRGAGVSTSYGVRNIVEFDYFPDAGFGATFSTTVISTNNVFAYYNNFPIEMTVHDTYRITLEYSASNLVLRTSVTSNNIPLRSLGEVSLAGKPDFRVDSFAIISYSDAVQVGSPAYYGSVLAHGSVDNIQLTVPPRPVSNFHLQLTNSAWAGAFTTLPQWMYTLEVSDDLLSWRDGSATTRGNGGTLVLVDSHPVTRKAFYRVRAERM